MRKSPDGMKLTDDTLWSCPCIVRMHSYVVKSHSRMERSAEHVAERRKGESRFCTRRVVGVLVPSNFPVWSKAQSCTASVCPFKVLSKSPLS